jgi:reverse gyrase
MGKPKVITRDEAIAAGLTRYFNSKPCPHGHVSERHVCNRVCASCLKEQARERAKVKRAKAAGATLKANAATVKVNMMKITNAMLERALSSTARRCWQREPNESAKGYEARIVVFI